MSLCESRAGPGDLKHVLCSVTNNIIKSTFTPLAEQPGQCQYSLRLEQLKPTGVGEN